MFTVRCVVGAVLVLGMCGVSSFVMAAEFTSPAGYTFQIPEGWQAASILNANDLDPEFQNYLRDNKLDLNQIDVMVMGPAQFGELVANFNMVVVPGQIGISQGSLDRQMSQSKTEFAQIGMNISNQSGQLVTVSERQALQITHDALMPVDQTRIRQRQVLIPGGGKTFILSFTSSPENFASVAPVFDAVQKSLQVPALKSGFDMSSIMNGGMRGGIIGGCVGGIMAAFFGWRRKKPAQ